MTEQPVPAWRFWHPLRFWKVIVILLVFNVAFQLLGVGFREGLGLSFFTTGVASGLAGVLGIGTVFFLANKQRKAE